MGSPTLSRNCTTFFPGIITKIFNFFLAEIFQYFHPKVHTVDSDLSVHRQKHVKFCSLLANICVFLVFGLKFGLIFVSLGSFIRTE